jgi:hypothetical protein
MYEELKRNGYVNNRTTSSRNSRATCPPSAATKYAAISSYTKTED